ncbi:hypothetical protein EPUS_05797 [Endocarpon pusillum Z07020]|uniref:Uncharacterized protein n=1 Tax=Endocarpon pusillum (strain Z07020 / HMAS-L-300199) TaxID=1263415 RepID=U1GXJ6_ENDPU|nr:uncharacterized protein EPUS_05797 [Endocarpon pusillum Z07020]ERF77228.1 hypothetical protein EPUS_05797 [Endocarpon pusillum Z07020]
MLRLQSQQALKPLRDPLRGPLRNALHIRHVHVEQAPFSGPPSYATIARRSSSHPKAKEARERSELIDIHETGGASPNDSNILITDIDDRTLRSEVAELIGIPYLKKTTKVEATNKVDVIHGFIYSNKLRTPVFPMYFQAAQVLGTKRGPVPVTIAGYTHLVHVNDDTEWFQYNDAEFAHLQKLKAGTKAYYEEIRRLAREGQFVFLQRLRFVTAHRQNLEVNEKAMKKAHLKRLRMDLEKWRAAGSPPDAMPPQLRLKELLNHCKNQRILTNISGLYKLQQTGKLDLGGDPGQRMKGDQAGAKIPPLPVKKVIRRPPKRRKVGVYMNDTVVVDPKQGANVLIWHRLLPIGKSYLFTPLPIQDLSTGRLASAPKAIMNDDPQAIPFANFGDQAQMLLEMQPTAMEEIHGVGGLPQVLAVLVLAGILAVSEARSRNSDSCARHSIGGGASLIRHFMNKPDLETQKESPADKRIYIVQGTMKTLSTGYSLHRANTGVIIEPTINPMYEEQGAKRADSAQLTMLYLGIDENPTRASGINNDK